MHPNDIATEYATGERELPTEEELDEDDYSNSNPEDYGE